MNAVGRWSAVGFVVGVFWIILSFVFFTAPQSRLVDVIKAVAVISCPAFLITDLFLVPFVNAVIYGVAGWLWQRSHVTLLTNKAKNES